jgi:hypothetical protein
LREHPEHEVGGEQRHEPHQIAQAPQKAAIRVARLRF